MFKITQEHFNKTVLENAEFFCQTIEESIDDTIKQFTSQGVDLLGILTDPSIVTGENPIEVIKDKINSDIEDPEKVELFKELREIVNKGLQYKVYCGKTGMFDVSLTQLKSNISQDLKYAVLNFLLSLLDGYPDLLNDEGTEYIIQLLTEEEESVIYGLKLIVISSINHDGNRQRFVLHSIHEKVASIVSPNISDAALVQVCRVVIAITLDDDIRAETPRSYIFACEFANVLLKSFCYLLKVKKDSKTLIALLKALVAMNVNNDYCAKTEAEGGLVAVISILERTNNIKDLTVREEITAQCFNLLIALIGNASVKEKCMKFEVTEFICTAMVLFAKSKKIASSSLLLISKICLRTPEYGKLFFQMNFPELVVKCIRNFIDDSSIQAPGCWCIRNMASRNPEYHKQFLDLGAEDLLRYIAGKSTVRSADARIALTSLGCDIVAHEPWTGEFGDKLARD